jgi:exopolysaccharide biosynthesis polyprenyl glycosylphosphotransferase
MEPAREGVLEPPRRSRGGAVPLGGPAEARLLLQRRAPVNLRRHALRALVRLVVLVAADLAALVAMRALIRAARAGVFGEPLGAAMRRVLPAGYLRGWQFAVALLVGLLVTGTYGPGDRRRDVGRLFLGCALAAALPLWTPLWTHGLGAVLVQYALTVGLVWAGLVGERLAVDRVKGWVRAPGRDALDTLFVGSGPECRKAMASPAFAAGSEYRPIGFVDTDRALAPGALGHVADFPVLLAASGARVVVVCGHLDDGVFQGIVDAALAGGCQLLSLPRTVELAGVHPNVVWRRGVPLVELTAPSLKGWQLVVKRLVDVIGSAIGLLVAAPVMLVIAVAIKLDSPGPVLFRQQRVGLGGRRFAMLKFRTMRDGAEIDKPRLTSLNHTRDPRLFKIRDDPRVTRLGAQLRRWSLDELPQLWNVLAGDMSLVGPRPFFEADLCMYEERHLMRLGSKPGMTGLWQVKGRSDVHDFEKVVHLDREYVRRWSVWLDFKILALTIPAVIRRRGAY